MRAQRWDVRVRQWVYGPKASRAEEGSLLFA